MVITISFRDLPNLVIYQGHNFAYIVLPVPLHGRFGRFSIRPPGVYLYFLKEWFIGQLQSISGKSEKYDHSMIDQKLLDTGGIKAKCFHNDVK